MLKQLKIVNLSMAALIIEGKNGAKLELLANLAKELGFSVKEQSKLKAVKMPNAETIAATNELKAGKGKKFKSTKALFDSIK